MRPFLIALALAVAAPALAVPLQLTHQGQLADSAGVPLEGAHQLTVSLFADASGGSSLWTDTLDANLQDGAFSIVLGAGEALDAALFDGSVRYVELAVDGGAPLPQRLPLTSVPYAVRAGHADSAVRADTADALATPIAWDDIAGAPDDADTLASLACDPGEVPTFDGAGWTCGSPAPTTVDVSTLTGTIDVDNLPIGASSGTVAAGDHTHGFGQITGQAAFSQLPVGTTSTTVAVGNHSHDLGALSGSLDAARLTGTLDAARLPATLTANKAVLSSSLKVGADTATCGSTLAGTVRWNSGALEVCDGTAWRRLQVAGLNDGSSSANAGLSCKAILAANPGLPSGRRWIDPDGLGSGAAFEAWCDMTTAGGGWTVLANNHNADSEPTGCLPRLASHSTQVCGAPNAGEDFALLATGLAFREMVWAAYAGNFTSVSSYQYFTWSNDQNIPATTGDWHLNAGAYNQTVTGWESAAKLYCTNSYNRLVSVGSRVAVGGYYGSNRVTKFTAEPDAANWSMSFTDVYTTSGQGNFEGLDDFQDGYGCSDEWTPKADRGKSSFIMVR